MVWITVIAAAFGGELVVEARVPAEVTVGTQALAQLFYPGRLTTEVDDGETVITVLVNGRAQSLQATFGDEPVLLIVGKTGVTVEEGNRTANSDEEVSGMEEATLPDVSLRSASDVPLLVRIANKRIVLAPGEKRQLQSVLGEHDFSVRSRDGTVIYASGLIELTGGSVTVQVSEGRMPEFVGAGVSYRPKN